MKRRGHFICRGSVQGVFFRASARAEAQHLGLTGWVRNCPDGSVEAVAESLGDGIVSPLFWFAIFGLPGAFVYRAINTMDSMLGYKSERYINFGCAAARIDDLANFLPSRFIAFPSIVFSSLFMRSKHGLIDLVRHSFIYQKKHLSPNAGWLEAPVSRILDVSLGGVNCYKSRVVEYPKLNPDGKSAAPGHLVKCMWLITISAFTSAIFLNLFSYLINLLF